MGRVAGGGGGAAKAAGIRPTGSGGGTSSFAWSTLITADVIEQQIKQIKLSMDSNVTTRQSSRAEAIALLELTSRYSRCSSPSSTITTRPCDGRMMRQRCEMPSRVRRPMPKRIATGLQRSQGAQARLDRHCWRQRVRGTAPAEPANDWSLICDRAPLMVRLQSASMRSGDDGNEAAFKLISRSSHRSEFGRGDRRSSCLKKAWKIFRRRLREVRFRNAGCWSRDHQRCEDRVI